MLFNRIVNTQITFYLTFGFWWRKISFERRCPRMNDREVFRKNLNDFLQSSGKLQKDLAEFVGAKTTTVSGWTRGISYPRADAMEKIALFFGVPTTRLVGENSSSNNSNNKLQQDEPKNDDIRLLIRGLNKLTPEQVAQAKSVFRAMFAVTNPELFEGDDDK
jgi:transcriptional regulator with XRE-family HTH domain